MKIAKNLLEYLDCSIKDFTHETGGILGSDKTNTITEIVLDKNNINQHPCSYSPNTEYLNSVIEQWHTDNIQFLGIFHTHFGNAKTLSLGDKEYIAEILKSAPNETKKLYFPIYTLPNRDLIIYSAYLKNEKLIINQETVEII